MKQKFQCKHIFSELWKPEMRDYKMKQNHPLQISDSANLCISICIRTKGNRVICALSGTH